MICTIGGWTNIEYRRIIGLDDNTSYGYCKYPNEKKHRNGVSSNNSVEEKMISVVHHTLIVRER